MTLCHRRHLPWSLPLKEAKKEKVRESIYKIMTLTFFLFKEKATTAVGNSDLMSPANMALFKTMQKQMEKEKKETEQAANDGT